MKKIILLSIIPLSANAIEQLPEMVITSQPPTSTSNRIDNGYQQIKPNTEFNRSYADSLATDVEVSVQATSPQQQSPFVRGFTGYNNIMLIDGIRLNNSVVRSGPNQYWSTIDPFTIDESNLYFGQSALLYGSDAFGTAVNVQTRKRTDYSNEGFNWNGRTSYRFASAEQSNIGRAEFSGNYGKKLGFLIGTSIKDYGNMIGGNNTGEQPNTGYNEQDVDARFDWYLTNNSTMTFVHQQYNANDAWRNHRTTSATPANLVVGAAPGTYKYDIFNQNRQLDYIKFESFELPFVDELTTTTSFQQTYQTESFLKAKEGNQEQKLNDNTIGFNIKAKNNDTKLGSFTYGVDYYHDFVTSSGLNIKNITPPPVANNSNYDTLGVYLSDDIPLVKDRVILSLTSRYNYVAANLGTIVDNKNKVISATGLDTSWDSFTNGGRLSIGIDPTNHYKFFVGANQGWRAPTLVDLSGNALALGGIYQTPSPNIGPEKFVTYETGIGYTDTKTDSVLTFFRTNLDNSINKPTSDKVPADNNSYGYMQGISATINYSITKQIKTFGGIAWTEGYTTYNGYTDNISKVTPITGNVGIHYDVTDNIFTEFNTRLVGSQDKLSTSDRTDTTRIPPNGSAGYSLYGIRAGWKPIKSLTLHGAIDNLTNVDYRVLASGVNGYGRNFIVSVDYRF